MSTTDERLGAALAGAGALRKALGTFSAAVVRLDAVDPQTTEIVRLRCASHHDCHT